MTRITIVSDAWHPQINGAVTTLANTVSRLDALGHSVCVIEPSQFRSWPCPTYPEIALSLTTRQEMAQRISCSKPDYVLIAIEGPLGLAARRALIDGGIPFSTAQFTRFDDYLWQRIAMPRSITLRWLDWFHRPSGCVLTPTHTMRSLLEARGLPNVRTWRPGVDSSVFVRGRGYASALVERLPRPIHLYVGRLAVEKNIEAFLALELEGSQVVVGDGPLLPRLRRRYPRATYLGYQNAQAIAQICSASDVLVFPSRTDTFGHVMVEALSCGLPVAAYPVQGPLDILTDREIGAMNEDLAVAIEQALACDSAACAAFARTHFRWEKSTAELLDHLVPVNGSGASQALRKLAVDQRSSIN
jgi:glycosyltransferase involved in cell wall biosynthesis